MNEHLRSVDPMRKEVETENGNIFFYKKLVISTGGSVKALGSASEAAAPVYHLQTIDDADLFKDVMTKAHSKIALVVGGSFIGMELVNSLVANGFQVHLVLKGNGFWSGELGQIGDALLEGAMKENNVIIYKNTEVIQFEKPKEDSRNLITVHLKSGNKIDVDVIAAGVGILRNLDVFRNRGVDIRQGIVTNEYLETSAPGIWAAGDVAEYFDLTFQQHSVVGNWTNAFLQGRTAGLNMVADGVAVQKTPFKNIASYAITVLGNHITFLGDTLRFENTEIIERGVEGKFHERFFLVDNKLIGAIMMNKFEDKVKLQSWIDQGAILDQIKGVLADPTADLRAL